MQMVPGHPPALDRLYIYSSLAGTLGKRLAKAGVDNTETNRRDYRELFYTAPGIGAHLRCHLPRCRSIRLVAPQHVAAKAHLAQSRPQKLLANPLVLQQRAPHMNIHKLHFWQLLSAADGPG